MCPVSSQTKECGIFSILLDYAAFVLRSMFSLTKIRFESKKISENDIVTGEEEVFFLNFLVNVNNRHLSYKNLDFYPCDVYECHIKLTAGMIINNSGTRRKAELSQKGNKSQKIPFCLPCVEIAVFYVIRPFLHFRLML